MSFQIVVYCINRTQVFDTKTKAVHMHSFRIETVSLSVRLNSSIFNQVQNCAEIIRKQASPVNLPIGETNNTLFVWLWISANAASELHLL